jgi:hypothetical protein
MCSYRLGLNWYLDRTCLEESNLDMLKVLGDPRVNSNTMREHIGQCPGKPSKSWTDLTICTSYSSKSFYETYPRARAG